MRDENSKPQETIRHIEGGAYRECYVIVNRKSTDEPDNQKNSLKYQLAENVRYATKHSLPIAKLTLDGFCRNGIVSERHSAFKEDEELWFDGTGGVRFRIERPKFSRLVHWLSKGYFKGAIHLCWDRASRNKADNAIIKKLMKMGVDMRFTLTDYDRSSSGELHMDIDGMFAEYHSRVTAEKVSLTIKESRNGGLWTHKAPVGYLNPRSMESKPHDPVRAPLVRRFAELAADGWSLNDIARWAIDQGFTMPPVRRRRTEEEILADEESDERIDIAKTSRLPGANTVHRILTNRFYTGKLLTKEGVWIRSKCHEAIVPEALFERVQERLRQRNQSAHYSTLLEHPFRRMIKCGDCGRVYTPYPQKGILYFSARCTAGCPNPRKNFNLGFLSMKLGELLANLSFTESELALLDARTGTEIAILESQRSTLLEEVERKKKKMREDLAYLATHRIDLLRTGAYTPESLVAEEGKLNRELSTLHLEEEASDDAMRTTVRSVVRLSELMKNVAALYGVATPREKEEITQIIFSELALSGNTLRYQCATGFQPLAHRFIALGDPKAWLSELSANRWEVKQSIQQLSRFVPPTDSAI